MPPYFVPIGRLRFSYKAFGKIKNLQKIIYKSFFSLVRIKYKGSVMVNGNGSV
jgi:hypothetical protein